MLRTLRLLNLRILINHGHTEPTAKDEEPLNLSSSFIEEGTMPEKWLLATILKVGESSSQSQLTTEPESGVQEISKGKLKVKCNLCPHGH